jgi:L-2-hydroxyglutarate oxidase LhgO
MPDQHADVVVIGGGIVGLAVALEFTRRQPNLQVHVLEKESAVGQHQSGHNSGVIHSGLYYKPGSLKARMCVEGARAMLQFCRDHGIAHRVCGKLVAAADESELPRLENLRLRGEANGLQGVRVLSREELKDFEPHCSGIRGLFVPSTGITDFAAVCRKYAELLVSAGGALRTGIRVTGFRKDGTKPLVETTSASIQAGFVVNCAGLYSDEIARLAGDRPDVMIIPFRGEYYDLLPERASLVRALLYPVPDPQFPFLGVHFTRRIYGHVDAGPNAILALKREGYRKTDFSARDTLAWLRYPGFWRMGLRYWPNGLREFSRSLRKAAFVRALQRLVPEIRKEDLRPGGSGVRAQAVRRDGTLVDDFHFTASANMLHVLNVPSPAATASLVIAREIVSRVLETRPATLPLAKTSSPACGNLN